MLKTHDFYYDLPEELIAQTPLERRDGSRLMVLSKNTGEIEHRHFYDLPEYLQPGDTLVLNDSRVLPARLLGHRVPTMGAVEVLLLRDLGDGKWECLTRPGRKTQPGTALSFGDGELTATVVDAIADGNKIVQFHYDGIFLEVIERLGKMPLPPYIKAELQDQERYQTVYSRVSGSAAAPTAGLHFTPELIERMRTQGFSFEEVTLHVGAGTFLPVKDRDAAAHPMHTEHFEIRRSSVERLLEKWDNITAVGTTSVRTLESLTALAWRIRTSGAPDASRVIGQWELYDIPAEFSGREALQELSGYMEREGLDRLKASTQIMITPLDYEFRIVHNIVTNFHQPKSTLLLLVSAFVGDGWRRIYDYALGHGFRFLSYGDSSVLLRE